MAESINSDLIVRHYNFTGKINKREHDPGIKALFVVVIIVCCFIILENFLVLLTIWKTKKFHTPMYYFIGNLAMSDLLAGVVYTANILLSGDKTLKLTPTAWFFREGSMFVALSASIFSLLAIAIERHLTMLKNKLYVDKKTWRVFLLIGTCWLIAAIQGALPIMGWNCIDKIESCSTLLPLYQKAYILFCTSVFSIILMAIVVLYAHIYALVRKRSRRLVFRNLPHGRGTKGSEMSLALLRTVIIVLSCFITCWAPLFILMMLDVACSVRQCPVLFQLDWFLSLAVLNSGMNPLIYMLTGKEMRRAFLRMLPWGICSWSGSVFRRLIVGAEASRSKSDSSPKKEEPDYSPKEPVGSVENTPSYS